jgi:hypothetical protein
VFKILGSEKSSSRISKIEIEYVPDGLQEYVYFDEYDRMETVRINYNLIYQEILEDVDKKGEYLPEHKEKFDKIKYIQNNEWKEDLCEY